MLAACSTFQPGKPAGKELRELLGRELGQRPVEHDDPHLRVLAGGQIGGLPE